MKLKDKVVILTGVAGGIGRAFAKALVKELTPPFMQETSHNVICTITLLTRQRQISLLAS